ncbi:MAG: hypothetical protein FWG09_02610 [Synergistaceae bacterium]|nr:hypothetical protein [Synergistaceae bacterium]
MDDKGDIISIRSVDEKLSLGMWSKDGSPRLSIENKAKKTGAKRKLIRLNWVEKNDRTLTMSGEKKNESYNYDIKQLEPVLKHILEEYSVYSKFKMFYWKTITLLSNMVGSSINIIDPAEMALMPEKKRYYLWICDITESRDEGVFRPFFPMVETEKNIMPSPEGITFSGGQKGSEYLFKTGILRKLMGLNPARWYRPLQIAAAAMLLNFSFSGEDGSEMAEMLWHDHPDNPVVLKPDDPKMAKLGERIDMYIRHFHAIKDVKCEEGVYDSVAEMQKREYVRKKRFNLPVGAIGDVEYTVTTFEKDNEPVAFACVPSAATVRHDKDVVYHIPNDVFQKAKNDDTLDPVNLDEYFSLASLIKARQCSDWLERIAFFVSPFTGVKLQ